MPYYLSGANVGSTHSGPMRSSSAEGSLPKATSAVFYVFGVVAVTPWNVLILTLPYLLDELGQSPLRLRLASWMSTTFNVLVLVGLWITTQQANSLRPTFSITIAISALVVTLLALGTLPFWSLSPNALFSVAVVGSSPLAGSISLFRTPVIAVASAFGPEAIGSFFSGTALVAVVISAGVFLAAYVSETDSQGRIGLFISILLSISVSLVSLIAYHVGIRSIQTFKEKFESASLERDSERERLLEAPRDVELDRNEGVWGTTRRNWDYNLAQTMIGAVTLAVFPTVTTHAVPIDLDWTPLTFNAFHFLVFNLGDLAGRTLVLARRSPVPASFLLVSISVPVLIALMFPFCLISSPGVIGDFGFLALVFTFGSITGHISSLGFVAVGRQKGSDGGNGTRVLQLWMFVGYTVGSVLSTWIERSL
ncbi:Nucleoside transporter [Ceratobasidium sp. AG-Ba]|nr:Nucleoside transporter [Ceratobasidium sp. AG-Ba]QRW14165.1 Nucleoside transporter [Ceratobasidium sp. AG-Ba]